MQHEVLGKLTFDAEGGSWSGKRLFPTFVPFREAPHARGKAPTTFELLVAAEDNEQPSQAQVRAFQFFVEHENAVSDKIIDAVFRWYVRRRTQEREWFEEHDCPEIDQANKLRDLMTFHGLRIRRDEFKRTALTGFSFACKWDDEHGLGVLVHRGTVLEIGGADVAFSKPSSAGSVWLKTCTAAEKKAAQAVLKALRALRSREATSPLEAQYIKHVYGSRRRMQEHYRLRNAVQNGDQEQIRALVAKGVSINGVPDDSPAPLFIAIQHGNVELVKTMLELGADPRVEFYGKTPLQSAVEAIELWGYRPGGPLGDRLKDKHERLTEIVRILRDAEAT